MTHVLNSRLGAILALLMAVVAAVILARDVRADEDVPTTATVDGVGALPSFECKWELPDVDSSEPGMQYGPDDDPASNPGGPCDLGDDGPTMADGAKNMIQVAANTEDLPEPQKIELWAAVDHPNGISNISDVFWRVFHPDGSEKLQVHGARVPQAECGAWNTMFLAAIGNGELTNAAVRDPNDGMIARCLEGIKGLYHATFELSKHQACGEYRIVATAVNVSGANVSFTNYIDVLCNIHLDMDFETIDWGTISPGLTDIVGGDNNLNSLDKPTVVNRQNDGMGLKIKFSEMTGEEFGKVIDSFDAAFGRNAANLVKLDPLAAGETGDFGTGAFQVLCANETGKLDVSIHPPASLPADAYSGTITLIGYHVPGECKGAAHVLVGP